MPLWLAGEPLVLASKSAIRHAILRDAGLPVEIHPANIDERAIEQRSTKREAGELAALLAREKARTVAVRLPGRLVLGADQTLTLGERRFSKPADRERARQQLEALRGRTHQLHSAVALARDCAAHHAPLFGSLPGDLPRCRGPCTHGECRRLPSGGNRHPALRSYRW